MDFKIHSKGLIKSKHREKRLYLMIKNTDDRFFCGKCGKKFYYEDTLHVHKRSHNKASQYTCRICNLKFVLKSTIYRHVMTHVMIFTCQTCFQRFKYPWQLEQHVLSHIDSMLLHKCLYCKQIFTVPEKYAKHLKTHIRNKHKHKQIKTNLPKQRKYFDQNVSARNNANNNLNKLFSKCVNSSEEVELEASEHFDNFSKISHTSTSISKSGEIHEDAVSVCETTKKTDHFETSFNIGPVLNNIKLLDKADKKVENESIITKFECVLCKMSFESVKSFKQHVNSHEPPVSGTTNRMIDLTVHGRSKTVFVCGCCNKNFASWLFAENHLLHIFRHSMEGSCNQHKQFIDEMNLGSSKTVFEKYIFQYSVSMGNLKSTETGSSAKKTLIYHCAKCSTNFQDKLSLFGHVTNCKKVEAKFRCPECLIRFETNKLLKEHIQLGHKVKKIFTGTMPDLVIVTTDQISGPVEESKNIACKKCNIECNSMQEFIEHKSKHNAINSELDKVKFDCTICNMAHSSAAELYRHMQCHTRKSKSASKTAVYSDRMAKDKENGLWICKICNKSYSTKCNLTRHLTLHDESEKKEHKCPFCYRVFKYKRYLQHHIMYMHKAKEEREHLCHQCGAYFKSAQSLHQHTFIHTGEVESKRKLPCNYCEKHFKCKKELELHTRTHTGEKPFPCDHCSYRAAAYCNLQKHLNRRHKYPKEVNGRKKSLVGAEGKQNRKRKTVKEYAIEKLMEEVIEKF